ncbi:MAG: hypothetical protein ACN4GR_11750 [Arenicellales bacterium]
MYFSVIWHLFWNSIFPLKYQSGGTVFNGPEFISKDVDVLIPAALEDAITEENVRDVKAESA